MSLKEKIINNVSWLLIGVSFFYILVMLSFSYIIDIRQIDIFGFKSWITSNYSDPYFWMVVFDEASITEHIQWLYLIVILVIIMSHIFINHQKLTKKTALPWFFLFIGVYLMFLEDRFNIRHLGSHLISSNVFGIDTSTAAWRTSLTRTSIEVFFYFILASTMICAFLMILRNHTNQSKGIKFLLMGYLLYGLAAFASVTRNIGNWYAVVGTKVLDYIISGRELGWTASTSKTLSWKPLGFWFMDYVIEESIELLAVTFLLAAVLVYLPLSKYFEE